MSLLQIDISALSVMSVLFAFAGQYKCTDVIGIFRKLRPHRQLPDRPEDEGGELSDIKPSERAEGLIKGFFGKPGWVSRKELSIFNDLEPDADSQSTHRM